MRRSILVVVVVVGACGKAEDKKLDDKPAPSGPAKFDTLEGLADAAIAAVKSGDDAALGALMVAHKRDKLLEGYWSESKPNIALRKINLAKLSVLKKECKTWDAEEAYRDLPAGTKWGECLFVVTDDDGKNEFRIQVDDSSPTADGWKLFGLVNIWR